MMQQIKLACICHCLNLPLSNLDHCGYRSLVTAGDSVQCGFWSPNWCTCSHRWAQWLWQNDLANDHRRSRYSGRPFSHSEPTGLGRFWRMAKDASIHIVKPLLVNVSQPDLQNHHMEVRSKWVKTGFCKEGWKMVLDMHKTWQGSPKLDNFEVHHKPWFRRTRALVCLSSPESCRNISGYIQQI